MQVASHLIGRISSNGFIPNGPKISKNRDTLSSSTVPLPPEEVLFRRLGAPERYEEDDIYWANEDLKNSQTLPSSDLLKAIHAYTSDFYSLATNNKGLVDFSSMDETALIACGILLEEYSRHLLGESGDLVFVEGEERSNVAKLESTEPADEPHNLSETSDLPILEQRSRKRRKL